MTTYTCKTCQNVTALTAKACPNCGDVKPFQGQKMTYKESAAISYAERKGFLNGGGKMSYGKKLGFAVLGGFAFFVVVGLLNPPTEAEKAARLEAEKAEQLEEFKGRALSACRARIDQRLTRPETVEYGYGLLDRIVVEKEPGVWFVQRNLTSKNGFNMDVPMQYACQFKMDGDRFELITIEKTK